MKIMIAGVGNIFFGDDGFGVEVVQKLARERWPEEVRVVDYGIRGLHLAYALLEPLDLLIIIDAVCRKGAPGTLYLIEPDLSAPSADLDAHGMNLPSVFSAVRSLGGTFPRTLVVGCEVHEVMDRIGLSSAVADAVPEAVGMVRELVEKHRAVAGAA